ALALEIDVARGVVIQRAGALDEFTDEAIGALIGLGLAAGRERVGIGDLGDQLAGQLVAGLRGAAVLVAGRSAGDDRHADPQRDLGVDVHVLGVIDVAA